MKFVFVFISAALFATTTFGQKMAHADVNAILSVMPENEKINQDLQIYATGLNKMVGDKKAQLENVIQLFNQTLSAGDTLKAVELQKQGLELDKEVQTAGTQAERQLQQKRNELMLPVLERIRNAMEAVATKKGFDYVMNSVDGSGTSIVLWGPEGADITRAVVDELGIKLESQSEEPTQAAPVQDGKKKKK